MNIIRRIVDSIKTYWPEGTAASGVGTSSYALFSSGNILATSLVLVGGTLFTLYGGYVHVMDRRGDSYHKRIRHEIEDNSEEIRKRIEEDGRRTIESIRGCHKNNI